MRVARLHGRDHLGLGETAFIAEGPAAIALSRGGAPKRYRHTDPNEDSVGFALGEGGLLAVVADGHNGRGGSERAVDHVLDEAGPILTARAPAAEDDDAWRALAYQTLQAANRSILDADARARVPVGRSTLCIALVRPAEGRLIHVSAGDSHLFGVAGNEAREFASCSPGGGRPHFLGMAEEHDQRANTPLGCEQLQGLRALVLASDGLSEDGIGVDDPARAVLAAVNAAESAESQRDLRALASCRNVADSALESQRSQQAGDNIAVCVLWLAGTA